MDTGISEIVEFHDPFIFRLNGQCAQWNGYQWGNGVSYGGEPIMQNLVDVYPKSENDPPPGFKRY